MKRKMLAAFLAATMVGGLLVGCGNSGDTSGSSKSSSGTTSTASASGEADASVTKTELGEYTEENPYHLVFAFVEFYEQDDAARTAVQDALNEYMIPKYHIEVEFLPLQYAEYQQNTCKYFSFTVKIHICKLLPTYKSYCFQFNMTQ